MNLYLKRFVAALSLTISFSNQATASEFFPIATSVAKGANDTYVMERCAALDLSILNWAGEDGLNKFDPQLYNKMRDSYFAQKYVAVLMLANQGMTYESAVESNNRTEKAIRNLYVERFKENYATTGQAFNNDQFIGDDMNYCVEYSKAAAAMVDNSLGAKNWREAK